MKQRWNQLVVAFAFAANACAPHEAPSAKARAAISVSDPIQITTSSVGSALASTGETAIIVWSDGVSTLARRIDHTGALIDSTPLNLGAASQNRGVAADATDFLVLMDSTLVRVPASGTPTTFEPITLPFSNGHVAYESSDARWAVLEAGVGVTRIDPITLQVVSTTPYVGFSGFVEDFECSTTRCVFGGTNYVSQDDHHRFIVDLAGNLLFSAPDEFHNLSLAKGFSGGMVFTEGVMAGYLEPALPGALTGSIANDNDVAGATSVYLECRIGNLDGALSAFWIDLAPFSQPHPPYASDAMVPPSAETPGGARAAAFTDNTGLCAYTTPSGLFVRRITRKHVGDACLYNFECETDQCASDGTTTVCMDAVDTSTVATASSASGAGGAFNSSTNAGAGGATAVSSTASSVSGTGGAGGATAVSSSSVSSVSSSESGVAVSSSSTGETVSSSSATTAASSSSASSAASGGTTSAIAASSGATSSGATTPSSGVGGNTGNGAGGASGDGVTAPLTPTCGCELAGSSDGSSALALSLAACALVIARRRNGLVRGTGAGTLNA